MNKNGLKKWFINNEKYKLIHPCNVLNLDPHKSRINREFIYQFIDCAMQSRAHLEEVKPMVIFCCCGNTLCNTKADSLNHQSPTLQILPRNSERGS